MQPLLVPDCLQGCERDLKSAASRVPSLSRTNRCHAQGHVLGPPEGRSRGWAETHQPLRLREPRDRLGICYLPVSLIVHRDEIHEEHVVSHRVHSEYLHLEGGEHAPGTERRERSAKLRSSRQLRRAGAGLFPFSCSDTRPVVMTCPLAETTGRRKRQIHPSCVGRAATVFPSPRQHPERRAGAVLPLPPAPGPFVSDTRNAPSRWNGEAKGKKSIKSILGFCQGEVK